VIEIDAASQHRPSTHPRADRAFPFRTSQARWKGPTVIGRVPHAPRRGLQTPCSKHWRKPPPRVVFVLGHHGSARRPADDPSPVARFDFRASRWRPGGPPALTSPSRKQIGITPEPLQVVAQRARRGLKDCGEACLRPLSCCRLRFEVGRSGSCSGPCRAGNCSPGQWLWLPLSPWS